MTATTVPLNEDTRTFVPEYPDILIPVSLSPVPDRSDDSIKNDDYYDVWNETEAVSLKTLVHQGRILNAYYLLHKGGRDYKALIKDYDITPKEAERRRSIADLARFINEKAELMTNELYKLYTPNSFSYLCQISKKLPAHLDTEEVIKWQEKIWIDTTDLARQKRHTSSDFRPFKIADIDQVLNDLWIQESDLPEKIKKSQELKIVGTTSIIELLHNIDKLYVAMDEDELNEFEEYKQNLYQQLNREPGDPTSLEDIVANVAEESKFVANTYSSMTSAEEPPVEPKKLIANAVQREESGNVAKLTKAEEKLDSQLTKLLTTVLTMDTLGDRLYVTTGNGDQAIRQYLDHVNNVLDKEIIKEIERDGKKFAIKLTVERSI